LGIRINRPQMLEMSIWGDFWESEAIEIPEMSFCGDLDRYIFSYNLSFWGDFWESEAT
jgi:hypothetical protein